MTNEEVIAMINDMIGRCEARRKQARKDYYEYKGKGDCAREILLTRSLECTFFIRELKQLLQAITNEEYLPTCNNIAKLQDWTEAEEALSLYPDGPDKEEMRKLIEEVKEESKEIDKLLRETKEALAKLKDI